MQCSGSAMHLCQNLDGKYVVTTERHHTISKTTQITKFMWPTCGPPGSGRPQVGPTLAPWILLSGKLHYGLKKFTMTSWNGNIFRVTGHLCGEFTGPRWIPHHKGQWRGPLMFPLICVWINGWVNNRKAGDLRRYRAHYYVIVMWIPSTKMRCHQNLPNVVIKVKCATTFQDTENIRCPCGEWLPRLNITATEAKKKLCKCH